MQKDNAGLSVKERLNIIRYDYFYMSNALELLPEAYKILKPKERIAKSVEEEFEKYGIEKLKLC